MLTYDLDKRGNLARYDYLYRCIREDILSGRLSPGEKLPSKRTLAAHLNTAVVTVETAYAQLEAEGYLYAREKRGYYVCPVETQRGTEKTPEPLEEQPEPRWLLDLGGLGGGTEGFPFSVWARLTRRVLTERGEELLRATPHSGIPELRRAIARYLYRSRGISASPEQIVVGAGTEYLYNLLVQLLGRDLVYGLEDPGYSKAERVYTLNGAKCVFLSVDRQGVTGEEVEQSGCQVLHISPNHQFPTGAVTPISRRQGLLRWAQEREERYIIEDDYDSEFRFTGRPIPTLQSIDSIGKVIYVNTFSRTLAPSLRIGYMVLPRPLLETYRERLGFYSSTVPAIEQYTLALFLEEGCFERHLNRMRTFYRGRRDQVIRSIEASPLAGRSRVIGQEAGLHFLLELDTDRRDEVLEAEAAQAGIRLSFLTHYQRRPGGGWTHILVVQYPGLDPEGVKNGLGVLAELLDG